MANKKKKSPKKTVAKRRAPAKSKAKSKVKVKVKAKARAKAKPPRKAARKAKPARVSKPAAAPTRRAPLAAAKPAAVAVAPAPAPAPAAAPAAGIDRITALQEKLAALERMDDALRARLTNTQADIFTLNPTLDAVENEMQVVEARIAAAQTAVLAPPSQADVMALRDAVRDAENVIAQNAAVNQLISATTALLKTLQA